MKPTKYITVYTVSKAAVLRGIHNPHQLHKATGISVPKVTKMWNNNRKGKIDLEMLDKVCDALKCRLYEIIKRVPESEIENINSDSE